MKPNFATQTPSYNKRKIKVGAYEQSLLTFFLILLKGRLVLLYTRYK